MTAFQILIVVWLGIVTLALIIVALNRGPDEQFYMEQVKTCAFKTAIEERRAHEQRWHPETLPKPPFPFPADVNTVHRKSQEDMAKAIMKAHLEKPKTRKRK